MNLAHIANHPEILKEQYTNVDNKQTSGVYPHPLKFLTRQYKKNNLSNIFRVYS